jgi:hypothetical protein
MSTCTNCGRDLSGAFCSGCGTPAAEPGGHAAAAEEAAEAPATETDRGAASAVDDHEPREVAATTVIAATSADGAAGRVGLDEAIRTGTEPTSRRTPTWIPAAIGALVTAIIAAVIGLVVLPSDEAAAPSETSTTTTDATTTTETPATTQETTTTTAPAPTVAPARNVLDEPPGLYCRDLNAKGYSYADAVRYWEHHGRPSQMDATGNGIPCQTVYPAADVEAQWGVVPPGAIDFSSPLLTGFRQNKAIAESVGSQAMESDLTMLTSLSGATWTADMLLALGASYCNDWPLEFTSDGEGFLGGNGRSAWATAIAPVLGISVPAARSAIDSDLWRSYQYICE